MRRRVFSGLVAAGVPSRRLARFSHCGDEAWIVRSVDDPARHKVAANTCHDRFCVPCQRDRSRILAQNVLELVDGKMTRMITLTLRADSTPLSARLARLTACFQRLRSTVLWKRKVKGGAAFLELKHSATHDSWHVHLHLLVIGSYIPKQTLSQTWLRLTGDSPITDIRLVKSKETAAHYVTKYVSKPFDSELTHDTDHLAEAVLALQDAKLCTTFGCFRGKLLTSQPSPESWEYVGMLSEVLRRARAGDDDAAAIVRTLNQTAVHAALGFVADAPARPPPVQTPTVTRQTMLFADVFTMI